jgi:DNA-directed RNA polymerase subunit RPC12/RpoP
MLIIKNCGSCGRQVPTGTEVGERCLYCGARFDFLRHRQSSRNSLGGMKVVLIAAAIFVVLGAILPILARMAGAHHPAPQTVSSPLPAK